VMSFHAWSGFLLLQITASMRAVGLGVWTMTLMLTSNVGNIAGNWLLIFGNLGFPELGAMGAAWATVWARGLAVAIGVVVLSRGVDPAIRLTLGGWRPRWRFAWAVARTGFPVAAQWGVRMAAVLLVLLVVAPFGAADKAAYGIGTRLDTLTLFAGFGWGAACATLVGHALARRRVEEARAVTRHAALLNVVTMSVGGLVYFLFARDLILLFSLRTEAPPVEVLTAGQRYLRVEVLAYPALALCVVWAHALNGAGSVKTPLLLDVVGLLVVQVPLAHVLSRTRLGVAGAWWALVVSHTLLALVYYLVFRAGAWEKKRLR
jgi:Na+-driven multidrug efflux pump